MSCLKTMMKVDYNLDIDIYKRYMPSRQAIYRPTLSLPGIWDRYKDIRGPTHFPASNLRLIHVIFPSSSLQQCHRTLLVMWPQARSTPTPLPNLSLQHLRVRHRHMSTPSHPNSS